MLVRRGWLEIEGEDHRRDLAKLDDLDDHDGERSDDEDSVQSDPDWDPDNESGEDWSDGSESSEDGEASSG